MKSIIKFYENYMTNSTLSLDKHVRDIFVRWPVIVDARLEITPIEAVNNLIHLLPPQWKDMGVKVRDEF